MHFREWKILHFALKIVPKGQTKNNPALVEITALRQIDAKPLSKPMLTRFIDAYMRGNWGRWVNADIRM